MKTQRPIIGIFFEDIGNGDTCYYVGVDVASITEHPAAGDGDRWFYDVEFTDGHMERIFTNEKIFENTNAFWTAVFWG